MKKMRDNAGFFKVRQGMLALSVASFLLLLLATSHLSEAFVVRLPITTKSTFSLRSSIELHGVRAALRNRFRKYREPGDSSSSSSSSSADENVHHSTPETSRQGQNGEHGSTVVTSNGSIQQTHAVESELLESSTLSVAVVEEEYTVNGATTVDNNAMDARLLPPRVDSEMTQYEREFRTMMEHVESYTDKDVQSVADPKSRALFQGAREGATSPEVYRAFEILFHDLVPVRIAGRLIFKKLSQLMNDSRIHHQQQVDTVARDTGLNTQDVEKGRFAFLSVADYKNDGNTVLSLDQLVETGVATTVVEMLGYDDFDHFLANTRRDVKSELKFDDMMVALQQCPAGSNAAECNPHLVLQEIAKRMGNSTDVTAASDRKIKYARRYDDMVDAFREWENYIPEGQGRWYDVLRGCFVGAKISTVVKALKIVYMDYSALRLAGDSIFGIVSNIIEKSKKSKKRSR